MTKQKQIAHQKEIQKQMAADIQRKKQHEYSERCQYKPHFGPEQTDDLLIIQKSLEKAHKTSMNSQLRNQMQNSEMSK